jgi:hypothetical protein
VGSAAGVVGIEGAADTVWARAAEDGSSATATVSNIECRGETRTISLP